MNIWPWIECIVIHTLRSSREVSTPAPLKCRTDAFTKADFSWIRNFAIRENTTINLLYPPNCQTPLIDIGIIYRYAVSIRILKIHLFKVHTLNSLELDVKDDSQIGKIKLVWIVKQCKMDQNYIYWVIILYDSEWLPSQSIACCSWSHSYTVTEFWQKALLMQIKHQNELHIATFKCNKKACWTSKVTFERWMKELHV